jgi:hypothetical protein
MQTIKIRSFLGLCTYYTRFVSGFAITELMEEKPSSELQKWRPPFKY